MQEAKMDDPKYFSFSTFAHIWYPFNQTFFWGQADFFLQQYVAQKCNNFLMIQRIVRSRQMMFSRVENEKQ